MFDVRIPKMGASTVEVDLVTWHVAVGQEIKAGAVIADIESEKAHVDLEAEIDGTIAEILVSAGSVVEVGTVVCRIKE